MARLPYLLGAGVATGALAWAARSIWPAVVAHALVDAVVVTKKASGLGPGWFMKKPAPFAETGIDAPFVVNSVLQVVSILAGVWVLRRLRRSEPGHSIPLGS